MSVYNTLPSPLSRAFDSLYERDRWHSDFLKNEKKNRKGQGTIRPVRMLRQQKTTGPDRVPFETTTFSFQKVTCHVMLIDIQHVCPSWCAHLNLNTKIQILKFSMTSYAVPIRFK